MSDNPKTQVHGTVRVMVALDVEVCWADDESGMVAAAESARSQAEVAVGQALGSITGTTGGRVKLAEGTSPKGEPRRVSARLEIM